MCGRHALYQSSISLHNLTIWSKSLIIATRLSHSYFKVLFARSVTEIEPCFPMAPRRGFSLVLLSTLEEDGNLSFELVDLVYQKEDLFSGKFFAA